MKELGIKFVVIDPYCNCTASTMGDKWIAPRPGTDAALAEAIAYIWIKDDTYDKFFIENRTYGFAEWKKHILGKGEDKTPKTAGMGCQDLRYSRTYYYSPGQRMGSQEDHVGRRQYLRRDWRLPRSLCHRVGQTMRFADGHAGFRQTRCQLLGWHRRRELLLITASNSPDILIMVGTLSALSPKNPISPFDNPVTQKAYRLLLPEIVMNPPVSWIGEGFCGNDVEQQFQPLYLS